MIKKKDIKYAALHYINVHEIQDTLLKERKILSILYIIILILYFQGNNLKPLD